ncbi:hypothetical protein [Streptomyces olivoreticuli]|uniref:hypothetical protein n=1 Tax=Streptomyces olivoreticuli TaxID=68246 RepID=UPI000E25F7B1|nr:hypothetical protein [Streptomyces olivoreticuli]
MKSARIPFAGVPWTLGYGGVLLGGDSPLLPVRVDGLAAMPDIKAHDLELVNYDGLLPGRDYMRGRVVSITFRVMADSSEHLDLLMGEVAAAFTHSRNERPLEFALPGVAQGAWARVNGRVRKRDSSIDETYGQFHPLVDVQLDCAEPWIRAVHPILKQLEASTDFQRGGFRFQRRGALRMPLNIPRNGGWGPPRRAMLTNGSMDDAALSAEIRGPIEGPTLVCRENGAVVGRMGVQKWPDGTPFRLTAGERLVVEVPAVGSPTLTHYADGTSTGTAVPPTHTQWVRAEAGRTVEVSIEQTKTSYDGAASGHVEWQPGRFV